jgi:hypothetical protein
MLFLELKCSQMVQQMLSMHEAPSWAPALKKQQLLKDKAVAKLSLLCPAPFRNLTSGHAFLDNSSCQAKCWGVANLSLD